MPPLVIWTTIRYPVISVLMLSLLTSGPLEPNVYSSAGMLTLLVACFASLVLTNFGRTVTVAADTVLYCYALESEAGRWQARMGSVYGFVAAKAPQVPAPQRQLTISPNGDSPALLSLV